MSSQSRIPSILSWTRLGLAPVWAIVFHYSSESDWSVWAVFVLAAFAELTDVLDGVIARRTNSTSPFGQVVDTLADQIFRYTVLLGLLAENTVSLWLLIILLYFDCSAAVLKTIHAYQHGMHERGVLGKILSTIFSSTILILLLGRALGWGTGASGPPIWSNAVLLVAIAIIAGFGIAELRMMKRSAEA